MQPAEIHQWLVQGTAGQLAQVLDTMAGEAPATIATTGVTLPQTECFYWEIPATFGEGAQIVVAGSSKDCFRLGSRILAAAGLDLEDDETVLGTFQETVDQVLSGLVHSATSLLGREITVSPAKRNLSYAPNADDQWTNVSLTFADGEESRFYFLWNARLIHGFANPPAAATAESGTSQAAPRALPPASQAVAGPQARNADLLFDVELPVCVSFGRAYVQLKDVLKLTTGSIVELNRTVSEPVEIIVNNCVIARGEVVVVEGNFGVRIHEVISRQERLRTLH